jgi:hypothetical protein
MTIITKGIINTFKEGGGTPPPVELPPVITLHPTDVTVVEGETATFTADADDYLTVQWWFSVAGGGWGHVSEPSGTTPTLTTDVLDVGNDGYQYKAIYTNATGEAETAPALLTVTPITILLAGTNNG